MSRLYQHLYLPSLILAMSRLFHTLPCQVYFCGHWYLISTMFDCWCLKLLWFLGGAPRKQLEALQGGVPTIGFEMMTGNVGPCWYRRFSGAWFEKSVPNGNFGDGSSWYYIVWLTTGFGFWVLGGLQSKSTPSTKGFMALALRIKTYLLLGGRSTLAKKCTVHIPEDTHAHMCLKRRIQMYMCVCVRLGYMCIYIYIYTCFHFPLSRCTSKGSGLTSGFFAVETLAVDICCLAVCTYGACASSTSMVIYLLIYGTRWIQSGFTICPTLR